MAKTVFFAAIGLFLLPGMALAQTPLPPRLPPPPATTPLPVMPAPTAGPGSAPAATQAAAAAGLPWMNASLPPDTRADLVMAAMTQEEKLHLVHGYGTSTPASNGGAGLVLGVPRLNLPDLNLADSSVGVTRNAARGRVSTLLPSDIGAAASWDPQIAYEYGEQIGRELRDQGYNASLAGGIDIDREPRNGRNFEYLGEDPVLAGESYAQFVQGLQAQNVIGTIKHFAMNDQETGRTIGNAVISEKAMRESDLLAFEIGVKKGQPGMVMCAYNKVNGDWACENDYLLNRTLKQEWDFKGFVMSDWGATHSTQKAALAGLDQEQPGATFFGDALKQAVADGSVPQARLDDMVHRILRTEFATGIVDKPVVPQAPDVFAGLDVARHISEAASVLLKNDGLLPLKPEEAKTIFLVGSHADAGMLTGGGSAQVNPPGGNAVPGNGSVWWPSSPLKAIKARVPDATVSFNAGSDPMAAAQAARGAAVAIVFVNQPASEGRDQVNLSLPDDQDALVTAVANANPHTIVVLETGAAVTMPWLSKVAAVVEVWYPGSSGAEATAGLLFGDVNFTGKLPITFPGAESELPAPVIAGSSHRGSSSFEVPYPEEAAVGYKWYQANRLTPLFPFGFGLSYTRYAYSDLKVLPESVSFTVRNTGVRDGAEIAQVYAQVPGERGRYSRLVGWSKVPLKAGESRTVTVPVDQTYLSVWDTAHHRWVMAAGDYAITVGPDSHTALLTGDFSLAAAR